MLSIIRYSLVRSCLFILGFTFFSAQATTHQVLSLSDSGPYTLRMQIANAFYGDTIRLYSGLIATGSDTIFLSSPITIAKGITIKGAYSATDTLYISGNNTTFIFNINYASAVFLDSLAFINGKNNDPYNGGAISCGNTDSLIINNCLFKSNKCGYMASTAFNVGGAIFCLAPLTIKNSSFILNKTESYSHAMGGAIYCSMPVKVFESSFENNFTNVSSSHSFGGAVYALSDISIIRSTFFTNSAKTLSNKNGHGGAIYSTGNVHISHSTFYQNLAAFGGAIYAVTTNGWVDVTNSTIANNFAVSTSFADWGGICSWNPVTVNNSIIALNGSTNIQSGVYSNGHNIFSGNMNYNGASGMLQSDIAVSQGSQLKLGPLAYNGGFTKTRVPDILSPAINAGAAADTSSAQNGPLSGRRDIGAAENCAAIRIDSIESCKSYTWINGNRYFESINNVMHNYGSNTQNGCDSLAVLHLQVFKLDTTLSFNGTTIQSNQQNAQYQWFDVGLNYLPITNQTGISYSPWKNGTFAVQITKNSCTDTSVVFTLNNFSINALEKNDFQIYPNPNRGKFTIEVPQEESVFLSIYTINGQLIKEIQNDAGADFNIDLGPSPGIYLLEFKTPDARWYQRVIVSDF